MMIKELREKLKWLDPFTYVDLYLMPKINPDNNKTIETVVYIVSAFVFAFVLYNFVLSFLLGTEVPLVIVYSGSMEPNLYRGDVVVLSGVDDLELNKVDLNESIKGKSLNEIADIAYRSTSMGLLRPAALVIDGKNYFLDDDGPIVVYNSSLRNQDIIHRAVFLFSADDGNFVVTMGDNLLTNNRIDQDCLNGNCISMHPIQVSDLKGKYVIHIPLVGYVKLLLFDDLPRFLFG